MECGRDFEVSQNCKTTTLFFGKQTTKNTEGKDCGTPDAAMYRLHICCTTRPNCSFAIREMRNFSAAECRKAIRGNLRNVLHLIFRKLPLNNFWNSAFRKIPAPTGKSEDSEYQLETAVATNTGRRTCSPLATNTGRHTYDTSTRIRSTWAKDRGRRT